MNRQLTGLDVNSYPRGIYFYGQKGRRIDMVNRTLKGFSIITLSCLILTFYMGSVTQGQSKAFIKEIMERRLDGAKKIMAGLAINNWPQVEEGTEILLESTRPLGWKGAYRQKLEARDGSLRSAVKTLESFVEIRNGDGARLIYIQVIMSCMDCHNLRRE